MDNLIAVGNLDTRPTTIPNVLNSGSNRGVNTVQIAAPGTEILSTLHQVDPLAERYGFKTGTSMAAPLVAGGIALLVSHRPQYTDYKVIRSVLLNNTRIVPSIAGSIQGGRVLHLANLLNAPLVADTCPGNPNKISPGVCGCAVPDTYKDSDNDGTLDCVDQCPFNGGKVVPGVCGCGVSDIDGNANGVPDCIDAQLTSEVPARPTLRFVNQRTRIQARFTPRAAGGITYSVTITTVLPAKRNKDGRLMKMKKRNRVINTAKPQILIKLPKVGTRILVRYRYVMPGFSSQPSPSRAINIR